MHIQIFHSFKTCIATWKLVSCSWHQFTDLFSPIHEHFFNKIWHYGYFNDAVKCMLMPPWFFIKAHAVFQKKYSFQSQLRDFSDWKLNYQVLKVIDDFFLWQAKKNLNGQPTAKKFTHQMETSDLDMYVTWGQKSNIQTTSCCTLLHLSEVILHEWILTFCLASCLGPEKHGFWPKIN